MPSSRMAPKHFRTIPWEPTCQRHGPSRPQEFFTSPWARGGGLHPNDCSPIAQVLKTVQKNDTKSHKIIDNNPTNLDVICNDKNWTNSDPRLRCAFYLIISRSTMNPNVILARGYCVLSWSVALPLQRTEPKQILIDVQSITVTLSVRGVIGQIGMNVWMACWQAGG